MLSNTSCNWVISHVVEAEHAVDINNGEFGAITVQFELLGPVAAKHLAFLCDVGKAKFEHITRAATNDKTVSIGCKSADIVSTLQLRLRPLIQIVDGISLWRFINVESIFFSSLLTFWLFKGNDTTALAGGLTVFPVVDGIFAWNDDVSLGHSRVTRFNSNSFWFERAAHSVAKNESPFVFLLNFRN